MIRVHGLSHDQFVALMRLAEDNQNFESVDRPPQLRVIEGGRRSPAAACSQETPGIAAELRVVGY